MAIIDDVRSVSEALKGIPAQYVLKVVRIFTKPAEKHWAAEVNRCYNVRCAADLKGASSPEYVAANAAYNSAFDNYHRLKFLTLKLDEVDRFQTLGMNPAGFGTKAPTEVSVAA